MQATVAELATLINGNLIGDAQVVISGAAPLSDAEPGEITLIDGADKGQTLARCRASAVVASLVCSLPACRPSRWTTSTGPSPSLLGRFRPPRCRKRVGVSPWPW